jgi:hypothetical protein
MRSGKAPPQPPYGRDYWPRTHRPDVQAEFDSDRPCGNCGYNLRGLPIKSPCPECGSINGINPGDDTIPFNDSQSVFSFFSTIALVLFQPHDFAKLTWSPMRFEAAAARKFRRIVLVISVVSLCAVALDVTRLYAGWLAAVFALPFDFAAIVLWLNSVSLDPIAFVRGTGSPVVRRAEIIAHYTSASLVLAPLHVLLLVFVTREFTTVPELGWLVSAGLHLCLLLFQINLISLATAWLFYELVDTTRTRAIGLTLGRTMTTVGASLPLLIGVPALAAAVAWSFTH